MKKSIILLLCLLAMLTACDKPDATPDTQSSTASASISSNAVSSEADVNDEYAIHDIPEDMLTVEQSKKTFSEAGVSVAVPASWKGLEQKDDNGASYFFLHPELNDKCSFEFSFKNSEYYYKRTAEEYLIYISNAKRKNVKINAYTKQQLNEYWGVKVISSYTADDTEFIRIDYDYVVVGNRLYHFTIVYPAAQSDSFEEDFISILDSIELRETK